jgi:hypothetical protein
MQHFYVDRKISDNLYLISDRPGSFYLLRTIATGYKSKGRTSLQLVYEGKQTMNIDGFEYNLTIFREMVKKWNEPIDAQDLLKISNMFLDRLKFLSTIRDTLYSRLRTENVIFDSNYLLSYIGQQNDPSGKKVVDELIKLHKERLTKEILEYGLSIVEKQEFDQKEYLLKNKISSHDISAYENEELFCNLISNINRKAKTSDEQAQLLAELIGKLNDSGFDVQKFFPIYAFLSSSHSKILSDSPELIQIVTSSFISGGLNLNSTLFNVSSNKRMKHPDSLYPKEWAIFFGNDNLESVLTSSSSNNRGKRKFSFLTNTHSLGVFGNVFFYKDEKGVLHFTEEPTSSKFKPYQARDREFDQYFCRGIASMPVQKTSTSSQLNVTIPSSSKFRPFLSLRSRMGSSADREVITKHVQYFSEKYGLDHHLVMAMIEVESGFNHQAVSRAGAHGLMQIMPATQQDLGLTAPFDPKENIETGIQYLKQLLDRFPDLSLALAAYNAGPENVEKYKGIPPFRETQDYVRKVTANYDRRRATRE